MEGCIFVMVEKCLHRSGLCLPSFLLLGPRVVWYHIFALPRHHISIVCRRLERAGKKRKKKRATRIIVA
jgi:hypothetical protein